MKPEKSKKPWPAKDAMIQIYEKKLWGGNEGEFYSGSGSNHPDLVNPYVERLTAFLNSFDTPIVVCDLGCGDFNVGKELVPHAKKYIAVDIVPDLIKRNKEMFRNENLEFHCLDISKDEWPKADCVLLRNVLQHLSNADIQPIVQKLHHYNYIVLTEHIPEGDFTPNTDIISGQGIRIKKDSGVDITAPPFNFKAAKVEQWLSEPAKEGVGLVVTTLYRNV